MRVSPVTNSNYYANNKTTHKPNFGTLVTTKESIISSIEYAGKKISNHERQIILNTYDKIKPAMDKLNADVQLIFQYVPHLALGGWFRTYEKRFVLTVSPERRLHGRGWFSYNDWLKRREDSSDIAKDMIETAKKYVDEYDPTDDFVDKFFPLAWGGGRF